MIPIISIIACLFLITQLSSTTLQRFVISLIIGVSIYFIYGIRRSKLNNQEDDDVDVVKESEDVGEINIITDPTLIETKVE